jgi:hypothetical protein
MKARKAALTQFGIGNWVAFFAHARLAERAICFELPVVLAALDHVLARRC